MFDIFKEICDPVDLPCLRKWIVLESKKKVKSRSCLRTFSERQQPLLASACDSCVCVSIHTEQGCKRASASLFGNNCIVFPVCKNRVQVLQNTQEYDQRARPMCVLVLEELSCGTGRVRAVRSIQKSLNVVHDKCTQCPTIEAACANLCREFTSDFWIFFTPKVYTEGTSHFKMI